MELGRHELARTDAAPNPEKTLIGPKMTPAEYLAFDAACTERHEYMDGTLVAMSSVTRRHKAIVFNATMSLRAKFAPRGCELQFTQGKLLVEWANSDFYPDVFVACEMAGEDDPYVLCNACLVVKVLSKSSAHHDRGPKFDKHCKLECLQAYVVVHTTHRRVDLYGRLDHPYWRFSSYSAGEPFQVQRLNVQRTVDKFYTGTDVPAEEPSEPQPFAPVAQRNPPRTLGRKV